MKRRLISSGTSKQKCLEHGGTGEGALTAAKERAAAKESALRLLSRREYSVLELTTKLTVRFDAEVIEPLLQELIDQGLQSDERYARMILNARIARGQGPVRIAQELRGKGVASGLIAAVIENAEVDWFELARDTFLRRFGDFPSLDMKMQSKQYRFLQYRGFSTEQVRYAMNPEK